MFPNIFQVAVADESVTALLGALPTRFYHSGKSEQGGALPYATWQVVAGSPENYIDSAPDIDMYSIQIDVWANSLRSARNVAEALRDAFEGRAHITSWRGESTDETTNHHNYSFDIDWFEKRT